MAGREASPRGISRAERLNKLADDEDDPSKKHNLRGAAYDESGRKRGPFTFGLDSPEDMSDAPRYSRKR